MFVPKYTITNALLKDISTIDASKELILNTPLLPFLMTKLKNEALRDTVCFALNLEGNRLTEEEIQFLIDDREVTGSASDIREAQSYLNALRFLQDLGARRGNDAFILTLDELLELHRITMEGLSEGSRGKLRDKQVVVRSTSTGEISYSPPPSVEVPYLIEDLLAWFNGEDSREIHPVLKSGIIRFEIYRLHPFSGGNNLMASLLSNLVLSLEGYDTQGYVCIEEFFARNQMDYFLTLQSVANQVVLDVHERDLTKWLEFFTKGVALQISELKEHIKKSAVDSKAQDQLGEKVELNERQLTILEYLRRHKEMRNKDFRKMFPDFSDDTVLREMKFLKQKGMVKKVGTTKMATYVLGV